VKEDLVRLYEGDHPVFCDDKRGVVQDLQRLEERVHRRHMRSRTKRCLKNSGGFYTETSGQGRLWARRGWTREQVEEIIRDHKDAIAGSRQALVKSDQRTAITMVEADGTRICVKEYRYPTLRLRLKEYVRRSKGKKGWIMANGLVVRGVTAMIPVALLERRTWGLLREAFLMVESPPEHLELDRYVIRKFEDADQAGLEALRSFNESLSVFMAKLYHERIVHRDLKTCNVMVKEQAAGWQFGLVDVEDLQFNRKIRRKQLVRELMQLHTSTPLCITAVERMAFLRNFLKIIGGFDAEAIARDVVKESGGRRLVYVSLQGDVIREMDWRRWCSADGRPRTEEPG